MKFVELHPRGTWGGQKLISVAQLIQFLLMPWLLAQPEHQQELHWPNSTQNTTLQQKWTGNVNMFFYKQGWCAKSSVSLVVLPCLHQAPVPLSIFRSNSKFDENSECSSFKYTWPITTIFCTRHDSDTVVTCAKYRCNRPRIFYTRVFWIFIEFRIRSKYA